MQVRTLTEDLGLPIGTELVLDNGTAKQYIGWGLVEEIGSDPEPEPEPEPAPPEPEPAAKTTAAATATKTTAATTAAKTPPSEPAS
jgi:hypothetical protein